MFEEFWEKAAASELAWFKKWERVLDWHPERMGTSPEPYVKWFAGGTLNVSTNCLDRHVSAGQGNKPAIIWHGESGDRRVITYSELLKQVCKLANALQGLGIQKGDVVTIYMPMIPEAAVAMLACTRIGSIHSVVFSAFSAQALADRINDGQAKLIITTDMSHYGGKEVSLKNTVEEALKQCPSVQHVLSGRWWEEIMNDPMLPETFKPAQQDSEDPLFILYTSGSTGKPKGVLHTTGGYLLYVHLTLKNLFDARPNDIYYCTADIGWITGHSYVVYGPLSNGLTTIMFAGQPTYPTPDRFWQIIEQEKVNIFYTAPTAIRTLMAAGDEWPNKYNLSSLRVLGSVGEPINPAAWQWYFSVIGQEKCPIIDTWWQTETGGIMIAPSPHEVPAKAGCARRPFAGIVTEIRDGNLVITQPWPGMLRGVYGDAKHERIKETYFTKYPDVYLTGDGAYLDADGDIWITGRVDDVMNVSAHRFSSAEIEAALTSHASAVEAAVVGIPDERTGQALYAFVIPAFGTEPDPALADVLRKHVRKQIGPICNVAHIQFVKALPKTRSGKIMRRILRALATGNLADIGDTSTLADPSVVEQLQQSR